MTWFPVGGGSWNVRAPGEADGQREVVVQERDEGIHDFCDAAALGTEMPVERAVLAFPRVSAGSGATLPPVSGPDIPDPGQRQLTTIVTRNANNKTVDIPNATHRLGGT